MVSSQKPFDLGTSFHGRKQYRENDVLLYENGGIGYISKDKITKNIDLVDRIINKLYYYNYLRDDLRQVALMGLFKAVNKYNDEYGVLFSTYASYFIIGEIKRELRNNKLIKTGKKVTKVITLLHDNYTLKEIKEVTGFADDIIYTGLMYKDNIKSCEVEIIDLIPFVICL